MKTSNCPQVWAGAQPYTMLSIGVAGFIGETLVLTFQGSKNGVDKYMDALFPQVLHVFWVKKGQKH
jgi:cyclic pyranopterin monophosphate synthase